MKPLLFVRFTYFRLDAVVLIGLARLLQLGRVFRVDLGVEFDLEVGQLLALNVAVATAVAAAAAVGAGRLFRKAASTHLFAYRILKIDRPCCSTSIANVSPFFSDRCRCS